MCHLPVTLGKWVTIFRSSFTLRCIPWWVISLTFVVAGVGSRSARLSCPRVQSLFFEHVLSAHSPEEITGFVSGSCRGPDIWLESYTNHKDYITATILTDDNLIYRANGNKNTDANIIMIQFFIHPWYEFFVSHSRSTQVL